MSELTRYLIVAAGSGAIGYFFGAKIYSSLTAEFTKLETNVVTAIKTELAKIKL